MLGEGIAKGFVETARNFFGSYLSKDRLTTVQFPEERLPRSRRRETFRFLSTTATIGRRGCAAWAARFARKNARLSASTSKRAKTKSRTRWARLQFYPAVFNIDVSVCMSCQICVEVCPFEAIKMDTEFELSTDDRFGGLLVE